MCDCDCVCLPTLASMYDLIPRSVATNPTWTNQLIGNKAAHADYGNRDVTESGTTEPIKLFQDNHQRIEDHTLECPVPN